jgi:AP-2 complex subunit alpha
MTPCPWLQIKIYQILQLMPVPREKSTIEEIDRLVKKTFTSTEVTKHVNKNNSDHSILFEAIRLTMCMGNYAS